MLARFTRFAAAIPVVAVSAILLGGLGGCAGNKKDDDIARLTGERDALREGIAKDRAAIQGIESAPPPVAQTDPGRNRPSYADNDPSFGDGTTTRRENSDLIVSVAGDVLFDSGSVTLKPSAKKTLERIARAINSQYSGNTVRVEGYTDSDPLRKTKDKYKDNEGLSAERALAVERYLVSKGVPARQIYAAAFGPSKPKSTKKASRRVEIVILNAR